MAYVEVREPNIVLHVPIERGDVCEIGRDEDNAVVLDDGTVSRKHALIRCTENGACYLFDLGSRNGTLLNNRRLTGSAVLQDGDRITIGVHELLFVLAEAKPASAPQAPDTTVSLSYQIVTTLVVDIRGFTQLSAQVGEQKLGTLVSEFNHRCSDHASQGGAWAEKYIGDAVMAVWLHADPPGPREILTVLVALDGMFDAVAGLDSALGLDVPIRIGAGINTGMSAVGNIGSDSSSDYTAVSDAVNLAFRLEAATKQLGCDVAIGDATYQALTSTGIQVSEFSLNNTILKGYERAQPVYATTRAGLRTTIEQLKNLLNNTGQATGA